MGIHVLHCLAGALKQDPNREYSGGPFRPKLIPTPKADEVGVPRCAIAFPHHANVH